MRASEIEARPIRGGHGHYPAVTHPSPSTPGMPLTLRWMDMPPPPPPPPPPVGAYGTGSGPMSPTGEPLANPGVRIVARLLDGLIVGLIEFVVAWILIGRHNSTGFDGIGGDASFVDLYVAALVGVAITFVWDA